MVETVGIPVEWREHIHPRRGGIAGPKIVLDEGAALRAREWERAARPIAEGMVEHERTVPELGRASGHGWTASPTRWARRPLPPSW